MKVGRGWWSEDKTRYFSFCFELEMELCESLSRQECLDLRSLERKLASPLTPPAKVTILSSSDWVKAKVFQCARAPAPTVRKRNRVTQRR